MFLMSTSIYDGRVPRVGLTEVTHVVVDPQILDSSDPRYERFQRWMECSHDQLWYVHYKFIPTKLKEGQKKVEPKDWSIFESRVQEMAKQEDKRLTRSTDDVQLLSLIHI